MTRYLLAFLLLAAYTSLAQNKTDRALKLPLISLERFSGLVPEPIVSDDGKRIFFLPNVIIEPATRSFEDREFQLPTDAYTHVTPVRVYSPDLKQSVYNYLAIVTQESGKRKRYDWITLGFGPQLRSASRFRFEEKDYVLGVMNDGKLITTEAGDIAYKLEGDKWSRAYGAQVGKMKGLQVVDPGSGSRRTISSDLLSGSGYYNAKVAVSGDSKKLLVSRSIKGKREEEVLVYDLETGAKSSFSWPTYHFQRGIGSKLVLVEQWGEFNAPEKKAAKVMRLSDGAILINQPTSGQYGMEQYYLSPKDELFYYDPEAATIASFKESGGEMKMAGLVTLDTAGLLLAPVKYYFKVMDEYIALIPTNVPNTYYKPYPLFAYFFDRKTGKPAIHVRPFFTQPPVLPTASEIAAKKRTKCDYLKQVMPFKEGSLLRNKTDYGGCERARYIFAGIDCDGGTYLLRTLDGRLMPLSDVFTGDYEACQGGKFSPCPDCNGQGHTTTSQTVADDKWEQVNFNVYVRNKNATKTETYTNKCKRCNGKGYLTQ